MQRLTGSSSGGGSGSTTVISGSTGSTRHAPTKSGLFSGIVSRYLQAAKKQ